MSSINIILMGLLGEAPRNAYEINKDIDECTREEHMTLFDFTEITDRFPGLLAPAAKFQNELQDKVLGKKFWTKISKKKVVLQNNEEVNVGQVLQAHMNKHAHNKIGKYKTAQITHLLASTGTRVGRMRRRGGRHKVGKC